MDILKNITQTLLLLMILNLVIINPITKKVAEVLIKIMELATMIEEVIMREDHIAVAVITKAEVIETKVKIQSPIMSMTLVAISQIIKVMPLITLTNLTTSLIKELEVVAPTPNLRRMMPITRKIKRRAPSDQVRLSINLTQPEEHTPRNSENHNKIRRGKGQS